jgi:TRAP-type transport system periplasmic protein
MRKLFSFVAAAAVGLMISSGPVLAAKTMKLGMVQTDEHPHTIAARKFAELVKEKTNGAVEVKVFANSQLGNGVSQVQAVKMGTLESFMDGAGWYGQLVGEYYIFATPYLMKDVEHTHRVANSPLASEINDKLLATHRVRMLTLTWDRLPRDVISKRPIKSLADVKGMKMRVPELTSFAEGWRALGASPTPIAFSEIYLALQQGLIEGVELSMDMFYNLKLHEVAKHLTLTAHQAEPCAMIVNERFWSSLTPKEQSAVKEALDEAGKLNAELIARDRTKIVDEMKKAGVTVYEIDRAEFRKATADLPFRLEDKGVWTKGTFARVQKID